MQENQLISFLISNVFVDNKAGQTEGRKCWRDEASDRIQAMLTIRNLKVGLHEARKEKLRAQLEIKSRVSPAHFWEIDR